MTTMAQALTTAESQFDEWLKDARKQVSEWLAVEGVTSPSIKAKAQSELERLVPEIRRDWMRKAHEMFATELADMVDDEGLT